MFLEAQNIVKKYTNHLALNDVSIQIPKNQIFGLLGPNGAGKTTLLRIITQITAPDSGKLWMKDKTLSFNDCYNIGYMPEERGLYKKMKVGELALYLAQLKGLSRIEAKKKISYWFEKMDIMNWWNKKLDELSKGMQQKVQFITTVAHDPELLIFDEPFSGFDPINADMLKKEIIALKENGATIIISTHNMSSVEELCDEIALINHAKVVLSGNVSTIRHNYMSNILQIKASSLSTNYSRLSEDGICEILSKNQKDSHIELCIHNKHDIPNNELIRTLLNYCEIISFQEKMPTMNEIFIQTVTNE